MNYSTKKGFGDFMLNNIFLLQLWTLLWTAFVLKVNNSSGQFCSPAGAGKEREKEFPCYLKWQHVQREILQPLPWFSITVQTELSLGKWRLFHIWMVNSLPWVMCMTQCSTGNGQLCHLFVARHDKPQPRARDPCESANLTHLPILSDERVPVPIPSVCICQN